MAGAQDKKASQLALPVAIVDSDSWGGYRPANGPDPALDIRISAELLRAPMASLTALASGTIPIAATGSIGTATIGKHLAKVMTFEEDFGAIGDGASHPLSERYATLAAAQVDYPFATALTDQIDWCALKKGIESGARNLVGRGQYYVNNIDLAHRIMFSDRQNITFLRGSAVKYTKFCYPVFVGLDLTGLLVDGLNLVALETAFDQAVRVTRTALAAVLGSTFRQIGADNNFNSTIGMYGCDGCSLINGKHAADVPGQFSSTPCIIYFHPKSDAAGNVGYRNKVENWDFDDYMFGVLYNAQWGMKVSDIRAGRFDQYRGDSGFWPNGHIVYASSATDVSNVGNLIENIIDRGEYIGSRGYVYTVNTSTDTFTSTAHGFANGDFVKFVGTPPLPLIRNKVYKVKTVATDTFQLSDYNGSSTLDITGTASADSKVCPRDNLCAVNARWLTKSTVRGIKSQRDQGLFSILEVDDVTIEDFIIDNEVITLAPTAGTVSSFTVAAGSIPPQGSWCGKEMRVISGPGVGEVRQIRSTSTAGVIKWFGADLGTAITTGSVIEVGTWGFCSQAPVIMPGTSVNRGLTLRNGKIRSIPALITSLSVNAGNPHKDLIIKDVLLDQDISVGFGGVIMCAANARIELDVMFRGAWPGADQPTLNWLTASADCKAVINVLPGSVQTMVEASTTGVVRCFTSWRGAGSWAHRDSGKILTDTLQTAGTGLRRSMDEPIKQVFKSASLTSSTAPTFAFEIPRDEAGVFVKGSYRLLLSLRQGSDWRHGEWRIDYIGTTSTQRFATEVTNTVRSGTNITGIAVAVNSSSVVTMTATLGSAVALICAGSFELIAPT